MVAVFNFCRERMSITRAESIAVSNNESSIVKERLNIQTAARQDETLRRKNNSCQIRLTLSKYQGMQQQYQVLRRDTAASALYQGMQPSRRISFGSWPSVIDEELGYIFLRNGISGQVKGRKASTLGHFTLNINSTSLLQKYGGEIDPGLTGMRYQGTNSAHVGIVVCRCYGNVVMPLSLWK
jgi:hypothetical protein